MEVEVEIDVYVIVVDQGVCYCGFLMLIGVECFVQFVEGYVWGVQDYFFEGGEVVIWYCCGLMGVDVVEVDLVFVVVLDLVFVYDVWMLVDCGGDVECGFQLGVFFGVGEVGDVGFVFDCFYMVFIWIVYVVQVVDDLFGLFVVIWVVEVCCLCLVVQD